jgi:hypothetical protein
MAASSSTIAIRFDTVCSNDVGQPWSQKCARFMFGCYRRPEVIICHIMPVHCHANARAAPDRVAEL